MLTRVYALLLTRVYATRTQLSPPQYAAITSGFFATLSKPVLERMIMKPFKAGMKGVMEGVADVVGRVEGVVVGVGEVRGVGRVWGGWVDEEGKYYSGPRAR